MNKEEFLAELEDRLSGLIEERQIREQIHYYGSYIEEEEEKGRRLDEILDELGDPGVLAKTLVEADEASYSSMSYEEGEGQESYRREEMYGNSYGQSSDADMEGLEEMARQARNKLLIAGAFVLGIFLLLLYFLGSILWRLAPILIPCFMIYWIVKIVRAGR